MLVVIFLIKKSMFLAAFFTSFFLGGGDLEIFSFFTFLKMTISILIQKKFSCDIFEKQNENDI